MEMNEKEKLLIEFAKKYNIALEVRGEHKEFVDKKGVLIMNPRIVEISYKVILKDD